MNLSASDSREVDPLFLCLEVNKTGRSLRSMHGQLRTRSKPSVMNGWPAVQAKLDSKAFYRRARRKLWAQVAALITVCVLYTTVAVVKQLVPGARDTPIIPASLYVSTE